MKILLLAVLATLALANPSYFPHRDAAGYNPEINNLYEEYMREQSYGTNHHASAQVSHSNVEIMAQSICTSINNNNGYVYAVQRICATSSGTCAEICTAPKLRAQDPQTSDRTWIAAAALHVYVDRPSSAPGTAADPHIGLKVLRYPNIHQSGCGPNYCCCLAPYT